MNNPLEFNPPIQPQTGQAPVPPQTSHRPKNRGRAVLIGGVIGGFLLGLIAGCAGGSDGTQATSAVPAPAPVPTVTVTAPAEPAATVTASAEPAPTKTVTTKPEPAPTVTVTEAAPEPEPAAEPDGIGDGTYIVGEDIKPGRYKAKADGVNCYWARLKDDSGDFDSIIANNNSSGSSTVTIKSSDGAFETSGCTPWVRQ